MNLCWQTWVEGSGWIIYVCGISSSFAESDVVFLLEYYFAIKVNFKRG